MKSRTAFTWAAVLTIVVILGCVLTSPRLYGKAWALEAITNPGDASTDTQIPESEWVPFQTVHYWTYDQKDAEFYFGPNAHTEAEEAIEAGTIDDELVYYVNFEDYEYDPEVDPATLDLGNLLYRAKYDPALCAALAADADFRHVSGEVPILTREADLMEDQPGAVANHAHEEFLKDSEYWETVWNRLLTIYTSEGSSWEVVEFDDYTSTMYMVKDGLRQGVPAIILRNTENSGGWFLKFTLQTEKDGEYITIYYRLNCGYQPIDPPGWEPPDTTPTPTPTPPTDTPTPTPPTDTPTPTPTGTPTPTPTGTPTPTPTSTPTPTPQPKDPADDPQNRVDPAEPGADDFRSDDGQNNNPDTTLTTEPTSPSSYATPTPPVATATPTPQPTATSTPRPTATPTPQPTATTAPTSTPTPTPVTGNSQSDNWAPLDDVVNNNPAPPVTDEPNFGDIDAPE